MVCSIGHGTCRVTSRIGQSKALTLAGRSIRYYSQNSQKPVDDRSDAFMYGYFGTIASFGIIGGIYGASNAENSVAGFVLGAPMGALAGVFLPITILAVCIVTRKQ